MKIGHKNHKFTNIKSAQESVSQDSSPTISIIANRGLRISQLMETKRTGDNLKTLVTIFVIWVINIDHIFRLPSGIQKMS